MPDCYTGVKTRFSIIGRNIENVKITDNWKNTFTKRLLTFLTVEKCGKLPWKFVKNSFTSTNLKHLIMLKWLNCITECLHFMTISWIQMNLEGSQSISGKNIYELFLALKCKRFDHPCGVNFFYWCDHNWAFCCLALHNLVVSIELRLSWAALVVPPSCTMHIIELWHFWV